MAFLVDTTILVRLENASDPDHAVAARATMALHQRGETLCLTPQNVVEFWNVATRPQATNGLGASPAEATASIAQFESAFSLLPDTPDIFPAWKAIVQSLGIIGKQVHDARLVAVCHVHGVTHLLTFYVRHFARMAAVGPGLTVVDPASV
jgi:predicted nucleic acid-binding protein